MGADQNHDWAELAASALEWWRDTGVDTLVDEAPRDWLARRQPSPFPAPAQPADTAPAALTVDLPQSLDAWAGWRIGDAAPEAGRAPQLIGGEGDPAAPVHVLVDFPESDVVLDGASGRLFDRMLAAIGLTRDAIWLSPFCAYRPASGTVPPDLVDTLAVVARHALALAKPRCVLLLGAAPSRALLGTDAAPGSGNFHSVNLDDATVKAVPSFHPRTLIQRPALKAVAWRDLQLILGEFR